MTREEAKQWIPLLQAYADGAEIINVSGAYFSDIIEFEDLCLADKHAVKCGEVISDDYRIKQQDHSKCVHNLSTNGGWAIKHQSWEHLCDCEGFCNRFRSIEQEQQK